MQEFISRVANRPCSCSDDFKTVGICDRCKAGAILKTHERRNLEWQNGPWGSEAFGENEKEEERPGQAMKIIYEETEYLKAARSLLMKLVKHFTGCGMSREEVFSHPDFVSMSKLIVKCSLAQRITLLIPVEEGRDSTAVPLRISFGKNELNNDSKD